MNKAIELQHNITEETRKYSGKGVKIAVMEASFNLKHPAIAHALSEPLHWYDGYENCNGLGYKVSNFYNNSAYHGNHVTGLICGIDHRNNERIGLATQATIIPVCGINTSSIAGEKLAAYIRALNFLKQTDAKIINLSQELLFTEEVQAILTEIVLDGKVIVCAAGNHSSCLDEKLSLSTSFLQNPILRQGLLVVGGIDKNNDRQVGYKACVGSNYVSANFRGNFIFANGTDRFSASASDYMEYTGTSMAAPTVTGALALLWEQNPSLTNAQIIKIVIGSGKVIEGSPYPKLDVANMLSKITQEKVLQDKTNSQNYFEKLTVESFPNIAISPNSFEMFAHLPLKGDFNFVRLSLADIQAFQASDLRYLQEQFAQQISKASQCAYYGLMQKTKTKEYLIVAVLALKMEGDLVYLAGTCFSVFECEKQLKNELAFRLGQYNYRNCYKKIYANWGNFAADNTHGNGLVDLSEPKHKYFNYLHAKAKESTCLPNIILDNSDQQLMKYKFNSFRRRDNVELYNALIAEPSAENYIYATSSNYHQYNVKIDDYTQYNFMAYVNCDSKILIYCPYIYNRPFFILSLLMSFKKHAQEMGLSVYGYADKRIVMPFYPAKINPLPKEDCGIISTDDIVLYELNEIAPLGHNGDKSLNVRPAFFDAIIDADKDVIAYFLNHMIDFNKLLNGDKDNALHIALRWSKDIELIKRLVDSGVDIFHENRFGDCPLDIANKVDFPAARDLLRKVAGIDDSKFKPQP